VLELKAKVATSEDNEQKAQRSIEDLMQKNEESNQRAQLLQRRCSELADRLHRSSEEESDTRKVMAENDRRIQELQRECGRWKDEAAKIEVEHTVQDFQDEGTALAEESRLECDRLRERMAAVAEAESEACKLVDQLRDQLSVTEQAEHEAKGLAEERLHLCERLEHRQGNLLAQSSAVEELEDQLRKVSEDAAINKQRLQQQIDAAAQGELQARQKVEEVVEKNRQLMRQYEDLQEKFRRSSEAELEALQASEHWQSKCKQLQQEDGFSKAEHSKLENDEENSRATRTAAAEAEHEACREAKQELVELKCKYIQERETCREAKQELVELRSECEDLRRKLADMEEKAKLHPEGSSAFQCESLSLVSPKLKIAFTPHRDFSPDFGSGTDDISLASPTRNSSIQESVPSATHWDERVAEEVTAREAAEARLHVAIQGIERLRPEYERFRQQAVKAVDAEEDAKRRIEDLLQKNADLQRECDQLRNKIPAATGSQREIEQKATSSPSRTNILHRECEEFRSQITSALEFEGEVSQLVSQLRCELANSVSREKTVRIAANSSQQRCRDLEQELQRLTHRANAALAAQPLLQDAADVESRHLREELAASARATAVSGALQIRCDTLEEECEHLKSKLHEAARDSSFAQPMLEDAVLTQAEADSLEQELWGCLEDGLRHNFGKRDWRGECAQLRDELETARSSVRDAHESTKVGLEVNERLKCELLEHDAELIIHQEAEKDARGAFDAGVLRYEKLHRAFEDLREQADAETGKAIVAAKHIESLELEAQKLRDQLSNAVESERLQAEATRLCSDEVKSMQKELHRLRDDSQHTAEASRLHIDAARSSKEEVITLREELNEFRDRLASATDAERTARRSAEAAAELMRRKEELQRVKQIKEDAERVVLAEKEARRTAQAALGLKRLIQDLGHDHSERLMVPKLAATTQSSNAMSRSVSQPSTASGSPTNQTLALPTFGFGL
jgi:hypothetical protein